MSERASMRVHLSIRFACYAIFFWVHCSTSLFAPRPGMPKSANGARFPPALADHACVLLRTCTQAAFVDTKANIINNAVSLLIDEGSQAPV